MAVATAKQHEGDKRATPAPPGLVLAQVPWHVQPVRLESCINSVTRTVDSLYRSAGHEAGKLFMAIQ